MKPIHPDAYRYPSEPLILAVTFLFVLAVIAFTATATVCTSLLFIGGMLALAYAANRVHHEELLKKARLVTAESAPGLAALVSQCQARLGVEAVKTYVAPGRVLNAYTFGLSTPKGVVLYGPLVQFMDADELRFIIGHELGHVRLGHTWLNSVLGGMAGVPSPFAAAVVLHFAFRWWNRACEFSADRAGLLACGNVNKAISALVRLGTGTGARDADSLARALQHLDAEDEDPAHLIGELLATHPLMIRRVEALRHYAASASYRQWHTQPGKT